MMRDLRWDERVDDSQLVRLYFRDPLLKTVYMLAGSLRSFNWSDLVRVEPVIRVPSRRRLTMRGLTMCEL